ncbi:MAG: hypothetical protein M5R36_03715 [Deltaproteobacteria bacterium]|nr:hypothetical protein [Deltaproteobacteria bacterium]
MGESLFSFMARRGRRFFFAFIFLMMLTSPMPGSPAYADGTIQSAPPPNRDEWAVLPIIAGNTDIGLAFGAYVQWTRFSEGYRPHRVQLPAQFMMSVKDGPDGTEFPTHDHFVSADFPGLGGGSPAAGVQSVLLS